MGAADGSIFARHSLEAGGFEVSYLKGGHDGDMDPVLYLHGMGGGGKWEAYHMTLGTFALTYAPQLPGWADGRAPDSIDSVQDYARLVSDFMDAAEIGRCVLAGHSFGGWVALSLCTAHPERFSRMILADSMGIALNDSTTLNLAEMDEESFAKAAFGRLGLIATAQPDGFGAEWENVRRGPEFERQWKGRGLVAGLINGASSDPDMTNRLGTITADTLLVWGREDGIVPLRHGEALRDAIPNSNLAVIDRCGHMPMAEKPETFNKIIRDFLVGDHQEIPEVVRV